MLKAIKVVGFVGMLAGSAYLGALGLMLMEGRCPERAHEAVDMVADAWDFYDRSRKGA